MDLDVLNATGEREQPTTEVGSYFVANYPPFSMWSPAHVPAAKAPGAPGFPSARLSRAGEHTRWGLTPVTLIFTAATLALVCVSLVTRPPSAATLQKFFGARIDAR